MLKFTINLSDHKSNFTVARLMNQGVDKNFVTGNDTSLLHKVSLDLDLHDNP